MPDIHSCFDYMNSNEDQFFYQITYDQNQKLLSVDRGQIRIGSKFQACVPRKLSNNSRNKLNAETDSENRETLLFNGETLKANQVLVDRYIKSVCKKPNLKNEKNKLKFTDTRASDDNMKVSRFFFIFLFIGLRTSEVK